MKVGQIMNRNVVSVKPDTKVAEIAKKLIQYNLTGVPVIDDKDEIVGIVTEFDLIRRKGVVDIPAYINILDSFLYLEDLAEVEEELRKMIGATAKEVMTKEVVTIDPDADISELAELLEDKHMNPVPVVKNGKLVGIVSRADIVRLLARE